MEVLFQDQSPQMCGELIVKSRNRLSLVSVQHPRDELRRSLDWVTVGVSDMDTELIGLAVGYMRVSLVLLDVHGRKKLIGESFFN